MTFSNLIPTDEQLIADLRYPVPSRFLEILGLLRGLEIPPPPSYPNAGEPFWDNFGFDWSADFFRPWFTPPELCIFGWQGAGGAYWGHVIYTPELSPTDAPIYYGAYTDSDPPELSARDSDEFFHQRGIRLISEDEALPEEDEGNEDSEDFPELDEAIIASWLPQVPESYRFVATEDNIGVMAPAAQFHPDHANLDVPDFHTRTQAYYALVEELLRKNHSTSALALLKDIHWKLSAGDERWSALSMEAYRMLDRPLHANNLKAADEYLRRPRD